MRISFERTGGFAGMHISHVVDTSTLSDEEANQLRRLVNVADFFHLPATIKSKSRQPDRFEYCITVEDDSVHHTVVVSEQAVPSTLQPAIDWLMAEARRR